MWSLWSGEVKRLDFEPIGKTLEPVYNHPVFDFSWGMIWTYSFSEVIRDNQQTKIGIFQNRASIQPHRRRPAGPDRIPGVDV